MSRRNGKIAHLPKDIRIQVNRMLDDALSYDSIISWLEQEGHPDFNRENLSNLQTVAPCYGVSQRVAPCRTPKFFTSQAQHSECLAPYSALPRCPSIHQSINPFPCPLPTTH